MICCRGEAQPWAKADTSEQNMDLKQEPKELLPINDDIDREHPEKVIKI